jgi:predicted transposase/invertase (TIGR01784 family)
MKKALHQIHDKFFKNSLKEKKIAIDFLKAYLSPSVYEKIDINSLQLTEKSFVIPELREIHSDIIYKCCINEKSAYLFFLIEHESTTKDELMAFRMLHYMVSLSYNHLRQGIRNYLLFCRCVFIMVRIRLILIPLSYMIASMIPSWPGN